jgi:alpha-L-rhamnosidase
MPRRYAARFIKIKIIAASQPLVLSDFVFEAETSAKEETLLPYSSSDSELTLIDRIAVNTLKNCMQRVFEDGPKRDRRLWIGDLRLEALANYYTFDSLELVKRCLYLFAAAEPNEHGIIPGYVYENPIFVSGSWYLIDYALMFVCSLCDFYIHTGDEQTFRDIYPVAKRIMDSLNSSADDSGLPTPSIGEIFIDWCRGLEKRSALVGVYLYTLDILSSALEELKDEDAKVYRERLAAGILAAKGKLFDKE